MRERPLELSPLFMEQRERLGNPQERLEMESTKWFLGGLITGEGCFCFSVQHVKARKGKLRITPIFSMFMSDEQTIRLAAAALDGMGLPVYMQERPKAGRGQIGIHIGGIKRVGRYCEELIPYLTGQKKEAAKIVHQFILSRGAQDKQAPYSDLELDLVRKLRDVNGNTKGKKNPL
jgi:hypothetical protein